MSAKLPFLPGYSFEQPRDSYRRSQKFAIVNGVRVSHDTPNVAPSASLTAQAPTDAADWERKSAQIAQPTAKSDKSGLPKWIMYNRQTLHFKGFFKEPVHGSATENFRVRRIVLTYHLSDDSIHISEPKQDNSGIPQGTLLKRHRIPKNDNSYYSYEDLRIGKNLSIYGRVYRLTDADKTTRKFFQDEQGVDLGPAEEIPDDPFMRAHAAKRTNFNKTMNPLKVFMEANMGRDMGISVAATTKFLKNSGKVLRFSCYWDDPSMYGQRQYYGLNYYLGDDTIEVLESKQSNSGRGSFPALLKRSRVPKDYKRTIANVATIGAIDRSSQDYYTEADLRIGKTVNVFGRELVLCTCDNFTEQFYRKEFGLTDEDFPKVSMSQPAPAPPKQPVPEWNGFGTEEDSMGSVTSLDPKPPRKNFHKLMSKDGQNIRFVAKFSSPAVEDADRRFVITYFMNDDTVSVFEKFIPNSGFIGGKFLERRRVKGPDGQYLDPADFFQGSQLNINSYNFTLLHADEYTYNYMEHNTDTFPKADINVVAQNLRDQGLDANAVDALKEVFLSADADKSGYIEKDEFGALLGKAGYKLTEHEVLTIVRKFDTNKDGKIDFEEFVKAVVA